MDNLEDPEDHSTNGVSIQETVPGIYCLHRHQGNHQKPIDDEFCDLGDGVPDTVDIALPDELFLSSSQESHTLRSLRSFLPPIPTHSHPQADLLGTGIGSSTALHDGPSVGVVCHFTCLSILFSFCQPLIVARFQPLCEGSKVLV